MQILKKADTRSLPHLGIPVRVPAFDNCEDPIETYRIPDYVNDHGLIGCGLPKGRTSAMVATSRHALVQLVEAGLGTTLLPQMAIDSGLIDGRQIDTTPRPSRADRKVVLAWRVGSGRGNDMRALAQTIQNSLRLAYDR